MDSFTQIALGAAVGVAVGGKRYGKKSALIGAICGTIPDLDGLLLMGNDPVTQFTYHRGFSHSIPFAILVTPILALLFSKIKWFGAAFKEWRLHLLIFLGLVTHPLLDGLTIYGTQLLWPLNTPPIGLGSIFIIDPLYTVPLILGLSIYFLKKSVRAVKVSLIISTLYLFLGVQTQHHVKHIFMDSYEAPYKRVLIQTTPFNSLLWRVLVMKENSYEVGYYSIFDKNKNIKFKSFTSQPKLIEPINESFAVERLNWFTKGFFNVKNKDSQIIMTDLRMGLEPDNYIFGFVVGEKQGRNVVSVPNKRYSQTRDMSALKDVWARIWDENVEL